MSITNRYIITLIFPVLFYSCTAEKPSVAGQENETETVTGDKIPGMPAADSSKTKLSGDFVDLNSYVSADDVRLTNLLNLSNLSENPDSGLLFTGSGGESESLHGRKEPLYVVDDVPVDFTRKASAGKWGDSEYQSATDIASLEKESVEILSGEKAIELYGEKGKHGVILITTKGGKKREISYIESSGDTTYTREDAASMGMMDLIKEQEDKKKNN
ncbi:hypothetical protein [Rhodohalobacter sp. 8-1]|uniref:hypothetical protein n=1 Tax=Rhodohalobacter sp. 8-1 TaxID=3131972 RepID=UPI0030ECCEC5